MKTEPKLTLNVKKKDFCKDMHWNVISKFSRWYFAKRALPYWAILFVDCALVWGVSVLVFMLEDGVSDTLSQFGTVAATMGVMLLAYLVGFRLLHTYSGVLRYSSFVDLQRVSFAMLVGVGLVGVAQVLLPAEVPGVRFRLSGLVMVYLLGTSLMWAVRVAVKFLYDATYRSAQAKRVFIYGAREGGIGLAKSIRNQALSNYQIVGFVSADKEMHGRLLMGAKVYPDDENLLRVMLEKDVQAVFVSPLRNEEFRENDRLVNDLIHQGIHIYMMSAAQEWDGRSSLDHTTLKEVEIEDLLPREKIEVDMEAIGALLKDKKILITGAAGSIGSEMVRQVARFAPAELVLIDQAETPMHDIRLLMERQFAYIPSVTVVTSIANREHMERIFAEHRPDYVFHAAAYKHVPMMEDNPAVAVQNNVYGTRVIADLAVKYGTKKFVMISTDKAVNPTNVMGCSKRICEIYCQSLNNAIAAGRVKGVTQFVTTRFGNVLGSNGSVIPIFKEQIKKGGPITVTHPDIIRYFMLIPEACRLVLEAGTMGQGGEIFVFDMGKPVRIVDLAERMILLSGAHHVKVQFTGLRDGEKLYEELLAAQENTKPTHHPKIMVAQVREYDYEVARRNEERLLEASYSFDDLAIVRLMKEIVPEFKSQHSKYEVLDGK